MSACRVSPCLVFANELWIVACPRSLLFTTFGACDCQGTTFAFFMSSCHWAPFSLSNLVLNVTCCFCLCCKLKNTDKDSCLSAQMLLAYQ